MRHTSQRPSILSTGWLAGLLRSAPNRSEVVRAPRTLFPRSLVASISEFSGSTFPLDVTDHESTLNSEFGSISTSQSVTSVPANQQTGEGDRHGDGDRSLSFHLVSVTDRSPFDTRSATLADEFRKRHTYTRRTESEAKNRLTSPRRVASRRATLRRCDVEGIDHRGSIY